MRLIRVTGSPASSPPSARTEDRALRLALRIGAVALVVIVAAFGTLYYLGQHVDAGPTLTERQVTTAEQQVRTAPNSITARLALARAYSADHRMSDALHQYDEILRAEPDHRAALLGRGGVLLATGDLSGAAKAYRSVTQVAVGGEFAGADPQLEEAHYFLALIASRQGQPKQAITEALAALAIEQTDSDAWYVLGTARLEVGAVDQAVVALRRAVLFVPTGWCDPYTQLVKAYGRLGQQPQREYATAMLDFCQHRPAAATQRLTRLTGSPVALDALLGLGMVSESLDERDQAVSWYRKALAVRPTDTRAITALSRLGVGPTGGPGAKTPSAKTPSTEPTAGAGGSAPAGNG